MAVLSSVKISDQIRDEVRLSSGFWLVTLLFFPVFFGIVSLSLGKDINWDLKNYHYYNAYAFLENRMDYDLAPAQMQTYINPILDLPFYLMVKNFHSAVAGYVLGFLHGINISLLFILYWNISLIHKKFVRFGIGIALCLFASLAPGFVSELGNTMNDNLVSLFVFLALIFILLSADADQADQRGRRLFLIGLAGLVLGLGVGLKPTLSVYAIGSAVALTVLFSSWKERFICIAIFGVFGLLGGLISSGFWWWELYTRFGNPTLPFYNHIFRSPFIAPARFVDTVFLPDFIWEYFFWPLIFSWDSYRVNPLKFFDIRFGVLYIAFLLLFITTFLRKLNLIMGPAVNHSEEVVHREKSRFILLFFIISFILWMVQSSVYRYLIPLELLVPICFLLVVVRIFKSRRMQLVVTIIVAGITLFVFKPFDWGRLDWTKSYFEVDTTRFEAKENVLVVMLGGAPISYVIPEFPEDFRFIRPQSNFLLSTYRDGFYSTMKKTIKKHEGPIYVLYNESDQGVKLKKSFKELGLRSTTNSCFVLKVNIPDVIKMCEVQNRQN